METKDYVTFFISVAAFAVSATTLYVKGPENRRTIRNQLTDTISKLLAVNSEERKAVNDLKKDSDNGKRAVLSGAYNDQRIFLADHAAFLTEQIPKFVSDAEYSFIAKAFAQIGDEQRSVSYWNKCLNAAKDDRSRALGTRGLGNYFFEIGNFEDGRQRYRESLSFATGTSDNLKKIRADTYLRWADDELRMGFIKEAEKNYDNAKVVIESIGTLRIKEHWLRILNEAQAAIKTAAL